MMKSRCGVVTSVCVTGSAEYLSRVRTIFVCLGRSVGIPGSRIEDAVLALTEACMGASVGCPGGAADGRFDITFTTCPDYVTAHVREFSSGRCLLESCGTTDGPGASPMNLLADGLELIRHENGFTMRIVKQVETAANSAPAPQAV